MNEYQGYLSNSLFNQEFKISKDQYIDSAQNLTFQNEKDSNLINGVQVLKDCISRLNQVFTKQQKDSCDEVFKIKRYGKENIQNGWKGLSRKQIVLNIKQRSKSRKKQLIYFKENQGIICQKDHNLSLPKYQKLNSNLQKSDVQEYRIQKTQNTQKNIIIKQESKDEVFTQNYFKKQLKTQYDQELDFYRVQRCQTQYQCLSINKKCQRSCSKQKKMSLKEKIQTKIKKGKQNKDKLIKNYNFDQNKIFIKPSIYRPLKNNHLKNNQKQIFSTDPFLYRQNKTLQNKKNKAEQLKKQMIYNEIKECTFKPVTNLYKKK